MPPSSKIIGTRLNEIYQGFSELIKMKWDDENIQKIILRKWELIKSPTILASNLLDPRNANEMNGDDINIAMNYILNYRNDSKWDEEVNRFVVFARKEYNKDIFGRLNVQAWWATIGSGKYPQLSSFADILYSIPCSSASAERC